MYEFFDDPSHSDVLVTIRGPDGQGRRFHLHKLPLVSKSNYFKRNATGETREMMLDLPAGRQCFHPLIVCSLAQPLVQAQAFLKSWVNTCTACRLP